MTEKLNGSEGIDMPIFPEHELRPSAVIVLGQSTRKAPEFNVDEMCVTAGISRAKTLGKGIDLYIISRNAENLAEFARNSGFGEEDGKIIAVSRSGSTPKQGETLGKLLSKLDYLDIVLVVPSFQKRAKGILEAWGTKPLKVVFADDEYVGDPNLSLEETAKRRALIKKWHRSASYGKDLLLELGLALEQKLDKKQKVPMAFASLIRRKKA